MEPLVDFIIKILIAPSSLMTWLFILAIGLYFYKDKKLSFVCGITAVSIYFVFGCGPVSQLLMSKLEYQYPQFQTSTSSTSHIDTIVVLTGSADLKPRTPISSHINKSSAYRLLESRRIYQLFPQSKIIITGLGITPEALKKVLVSMDVEENSIIIEKQSATTYESATNLRDMLAEKSFVLITSAGHMPRAMDVFRAQGLNPVPAPTEYLSRENIFSPEYLPSPKHLMNSDLAVHEYFGWVWYKLTGRI